MKKLDIMFVGWGENWRLGTLADNGTDLLFEYSPEALRRGIELSPRYLKLQSGAFGNFPHHQDRLPGLIADALPDGWGMLLMDRVFRKSGRDPASLSPLDRLAFINGRAMGALVFEPAGNLDAHYEDVALLELARAAQVVIHGKDSSCLKQLALMGGSPQGARPKILIQFEPSTGNISTLPDAPGTPWLVKFQSNSEHKEVCAIEHVYAQIARVCGLDMPATHYFDLDRKLAGFGIERFDRVGRLRIPVHTLAGALNVDFRRPSVDYATFLRVTRLFTCDESQVQKAFERCVFNVILNNRDDHAKNFSYRMNQRWEWELAPCYDLTFSEGPGGEHQMAIMGEGRAPAAADLLRLATDATLDTTWARGVVERISDGAGTFSKFAKASPIRAATVKTIVKAIESNQARMLVPPARVSKLK